MCLRDELDLRYEIERKTILIRTYLWEKWEIFGLILIFCLNSSFFYSELNN